MSLLRWLRLGSVQRRRRHRNFIPYFYGGDATLAYYANLIRVECRKRIRAEWRTKLLRARAAKMRGGIDIPGLPYE